MNTLIDLFTSGGLNTIFSGLTGLVGGYLSKRENRLLAIQENSHELAMAEMDMKADDQQLTATLELAKSKMQLAELEGDIKSDIIASKSSAKIDEIDAKGFADAVSEAQKPTGYPFVDKFKAMTRPVLTWALFVFMMILFAALHHRVGSVVAEDTELLIKLYVYLVQSLIYLFIMAVSWWFMSRGDKTTAQIKGLST